MKTKTAADLPEGSQIVYRTRTWTAGTHPQRRWETPDGTTAGPNPKHLGAVLDHDWWRLTDEQMQHLVGDGACIEFVPAGRGRWLKQEMEGRR